MPQQASTRIVSDRDLPELRAVHVRDAVVPRQALVHEGVVGIEQAQHALVLEDDALEEHFGFALHRLAQVVVEVGEDIGVGLQAAQVAQEQPLSREVAPERPRPFVLEHAANLLLDDGRFAQAAGDRQVQQFVVRDAAPEEEREPRRQLDVVDAIGGARRDVAGILFDSIEEPRADQEEGQRAFDALIERASSRALLLIEAEKPRRLGLVDRSAIRAARDRRENRSRASGARRDRTPVCT